MMAFIMNLGRKLGSLPMHICQKFSSLAIVAPV
jgi:hypothetical protein